MARNLVKQGGARLRKAAEEDPATTKPQAETPPDTVPVSEPASVQTSIPVSVPAPEKTSEKASDPASRTAGVSAREKASGKTAVPPASARPTTPARRRGRPRGPERVPLSVRILPATDDRLTQAVELTGQSPQYIVEAALEVYLKRIGISAARRRDSA